VWGLRTTLCPLRVAPSGWGRRGRRASEWLKPLRPWSCHGGAAGVRANGSGLPQGGHAGAVQRARGQHQGTTVNQALQGTAALPMLGLSPPWWPCP
jgi:hypothetical protein